MMLRINNKETKSPIRLKTEIIVRFIQNETTCLCNGCNDAIISGLTVKYHNNLYCVDCVIEELFSHTDGGKDE